MTQREQLEAWAADFNEPLVLLEGWDDALAGLVEGFGQPARACYRRSAVLAGLRAQGMTEEEAEEFFAFNIEGGYYGERTPVFLDDNCFVG